MTCRVTSGVFSRTVFRDQLQHGFVVLALFRKKGSSLKFANIAFHSFLLTAMVSAKSIVNLRVRLTLGFKFLSFLVKCRHFQIEGNLNRVN